MESKQQVEGEVMPAVENQPEAAPVQNSEISTQVKDEGIHLLLFSARESVQESLDFSPFEIVFGHTVRGPLKLPKEKLLSSESSFINLLQYVLDFGTKLNYVLVTPDRRKQTQLCHVNMIKPYIDRGSSLGVHPVSLNVISSEPEETLSIDCNDKLSPLTTAKLSNSDILRDLDFTLSHLSSMQRQDLTHLLQAFKYLFPDVPRPDDSYRMCTDNRKMNSVGESDTFPIPRMDDCIENVGNARFVTKFDSFKEFWQVSLTERDKESSAFAEPDELYHKNKGIT